jgi:hypothetical protein
MGAGEACLGMVILISAGILEIESKEKQQVN